MSELKATTVYDAYWTANSTGQGTGVWVYLKSEVDNVIAELKAQKAQAEDDCAYWKTMSRKCADDNEVMAKQRADAFKRERHQKYKRCLAMARWCASKVYHIRRTPLCDMSEHEYWQYENDFWQRWQKRWLELADKFKDKEAK